MNINFSLVNVSSIKKMQNNSLNKFNFNKTNNNDVFVKSNNVFVKSNIVSFKGSEFDEAYSDIKSNVINYVMNADNVDKTQLEKFIKKHSPTTTFGDFNRLTKINSNIVDATSGYIQQRLVLQQDENSLLLIVSPQKICIKDIPLNSKENKILYVQRLLHETTHALQEDSDYEYSVFNMTNEYLKSADNINLVLNSIEKAPALFKSVEQSMLDKFHSCLPRFSYTPEPINRYQTLDKLTMKKYKASMYSLIRSDIDKCLAQIGNSADKNFLIKYVNYKAHQEKDAYINEIQVAKELHNIQDKTNYDLIIDVYDALIRATEDKMKS